MTTPDPTATPTATPSPASVPAPVSNGPKYYVATNGNDGNSGSSSSPWRTIQHAADTVSAGDMVYVMGGTYNEKVTITRSGSPGNYIIFAAYPGQTVSIDGTGISLGSWDGLIRINGASYIQISGFRVLKSSYVGIMVSGGSPSNINIQNNYINGAYSSGIYVERASSITIDNNEVTGAHTAGAGTENEIVSLVHVNGFDVKNNKIHDNINTESINAKMGSSNGRIHHNNIKPTSSAGVYMDPFTEYQENVEVYDNIIHDGPGASRGIAVAVEGGGTIKNVKIYNNLVYRNGANGIVVDYYADCGNDPGTLCLSGTIDNILIEGNTVYQNNAIGWDGGIINKYSKSTNVVISNNIVSQNYGNQIWVVGSNTIQNNLIDGSTGTTGTSYITGSPQFVNPSSGDFRIQSTSPAINKGATPKIAIVDFDGKSRPQGGDYDIGAYEY
ncbi:MAG: DUF1565 domain-containing protein [Candidatus Methanoperedens sp.]|nr:MAG: DUF1565 domain-containing protein [Candidatus Methanoperedens sp.]